MNTIKKAPRAVNDTQERTEKHHGFIVSQDKRFVDVDEAMYILNCSRTIACKAIRECNDILKKAGKFTIQGRTNRTVFYNHVGYEERGQNEI